MSDHKTKVSFSLGTLFLWSVLTVILSGSILLTQIRKTQPPQQNASIPCVPTNPKPSGSIGSMPEHVAESVYGPVDQKALNEVKKDCGVTRWTRRACQQQVWYSPASSCYTTYQYQPQACYPTYAQGEIVRVVPQYSQPVTPLSQPTPQPYIPPPQPIAPAQPTISPSPVAPTLVKPSPLRIQPSCKDGSCFLLNIIQSK